MFVTDMIDETSLNLDKSFQEYTFFGIQTFFKLKCITDLFIVARL